MTKAVVNVEDQDDCMVVTLQLDVPSECLSARDDGALATITRMCRWSMGMIFVYRQ